MTGVRLAADAINAAIIHANARGGGEVVLPPGRHLSFSIRLLSGVTLKLEEGCVLEAADPAIHGEGAGIAVRRGDTDLVNRFNAALAAIRTDGTYARISNQYFGFDIYGG